MNKIVEIYFSNLQLGNKITPAFLAKILNADIGDFGDFSV